MPQILANLASSGGSTLNYQVSALPGYTLQQHASNSTTLGLIQTGGWDYVVLQEYSQYPSEPLSTVELYVFPYASSLHNQINSYNADARTLFYMTWGRKNGDAERCARLPEVCTYTGMDDLTRERYMIMAQQNQAEVSPVGAVWRYIRQHYPAIELYDTDGSHPSEAGSYAAACAFYTAIFRKDPALLSYNYSLTPAVANDIRSSAKAVVFNSLSTWYIGSYDVADHQAPTAPTGLIASNVQQTSLVLSWSASTDNVGIAGYNVYQNGVQVGNVSTTSINISGLTQLTTYTFTVRARDVAGNISPVSQALQVTTIDAEAPTVPTGLYVGNLTETGFTLSWSASSDNVRVSGYDVFRDGAFLTSVTGTSAAISGLTASTSYGMTVIAKDGAGNASSPCPVFQVTTPDTHAPSIPGGLVSAHITQTSFTLNWAASTDNVGVTGYEVYRNGVYVGTSVGNMMGISGLSAGTVYSLAVRAKDAAGNISAFSSLLEVRTLDPAPADNQAPTVPAGLASSGITHTSFTLSWNASSDNFGVAGYDVFQNGDWVATVTGTTASINGLSASTAYSMTVRAKDAAGNTSASSAPLSVVTHEIETIDNQPPSVPSNLFSSNLTPTSFTLNWTASTDNTGVAEYEVFLNGMLITSASTTSADVSALIASNTYNVAVRAKDAAGNVSGLSNTLQVVTPESTVPDAEAPSVPTGLHAGNVTIEGFELSWTASTDNIGVAGYDVFLNGSLTTSVSTTSVVLHYLVAATNYMVTVKAKDAAGNFSDASSAIAVTTRQNIPADTEAPSVPTGLTASLITETGFGLSWIASTDNIGVTGYDVYRDGGLLFSVTGTSVNLSGLGAGITYSMTVRAKDAAGNITGPSAVLQVTTADFQAPTAPAGLIVTALTQAGFTLSWNPSTDNAGVVAYHVYRNGLLFTTVTGNSVQISGLSAATSYSMSVRATDGAGNISSNSSVLVVTTPDTQAPGAPTGLVSSNITQTSFSLGWTPSVDNVGVVGYDIYRNGIFYLSVTGTNAGISGLSAFTGYMMTVRARDAAGNVSAASAVLNVTTLDNQPPTTPTGLSSGNLTQSGFRLTWNASTDNVGVTGYYVYQNGTLVTTVQSNNAQISGLRASTSYVMTVRARDAAGNTSGLSSSITVITPDTEAPSIPAGLTFHDLSQTGFTLTWNVSLDNVGVTGYDIYRDGVFVTSVVGTAAGITNLSAFRTYAMTVRAKDAAGNVSAASAILNVTTPDTECPTAPTQLTYADLTQSGFSLSWSAATDNVGVTGYDIFHDGILLRSVTGTTVLLTGLKASTTYRIIVRSRDGAGNLSDPSALITVITPDTEAPTTPSDLTCTNLVQSGFALNWKASTDNVAVTGYEVYQNGIMVQVVTHNEVIIGGLQACRTYSMTVRAKDAAGNFSNLSTVLNITTPDTEAPQVPGALTTEDITETGFTLKWATSLDNVGVTGYEIYRDGILVTLCTGTTAEVNNLQAYKTYAMQVVAKDAAGNASPASNRLYVRTADTHPPSVPEKLQAGSITDTTLTLRWNPAMDNVGVAAYDVILNHTHAFTGSDTVCNFVNLRASTTYLLQVVARDSAGNMSSVSDGLTLITPDTRCPSIPCGLTADPVDRKSFLLKWDPALDNVAVTTYYIYQDDAIIAESHDTMVWISGLNTHTSYRMTIQAADAAGNISSFSDSLVVTTKYPGDDNSVTVFPNPVTDNVFYIDLGREKNPETLVDIIDLSGNLVYRLTIINPERLIEISGMDIPTGTYFVKILSGGNAYSNKVLIDTY